MGTSIDEIYTGALGATNLAVGDLASIINPLAAQLDAAISLGLGPLQTDLAASLDASLALQASLSLSVADPTASIRAALAAIVDLTAALSAALSLPPLQLPQVDADISAAAALSATLSARLGAIQLLIDAMLSVKIPALQLADIPLGVGPIVLLVFDGLNVLGGGGTMTLEEAGNKIQTEFSSGVGSPPIAPTDNTSGIILLVGASPTATAAFNALRALFYP